MGLKEQFDKLKENWLLIAIILVVFLFMSGAGSVMRSASNSFGGIAMMDQVGYAESYKSSASGGYYPPSPGYGGDFAPEVEERVIIKNAYMTNQVEKGEFESAESKIKAILQSSDAYLLNENVNQQDSGWKTYYSGSYSIKVDSRKYDSVLTQLRAIGEVKSFSENANDVTGSYTNIQTEIEVEKSRLARYEEMYKDAVEIKDKMELNDRIFNQERTIKYLEQSLKNIDTKVEYSQISFSLSEKRSEYISVQFVRFSELIRNLVDSANTVFRLLFIAFPWLVVYLVYKFVRKLRRKQ